MTIQQVVPENYESLIKLLKDFFPVHNRFKKSDEDIKSYLENVANRCDFLVNVVDEEVKACTVLVKIDQNAEGTHKVWKFMHLAYSDEESAKELLAHAEELIQTKSETAKIELRIAENEPCLDFLKSQGYEQEGELKNHYRWNETCFILSKSIQRT
jgi:hypothetical protein